MKNKNLLYRSSLAKGSLLAIVPLVLLHSALGGITVTFTESGPDVIVSFDGTLAINPAIVSEISQTGKGGLVDNGKIASRASGSYYAASSGAASPSGLNLGSLSTPESGDVGYFGFSFGNLYWTSGDISGGSVLGGVTELTVSPATASFTLPGESLASLNATGIAQGQVLWTANTTNDTMIFASVAVPEPSSLLLCGLGAAGLWRRRR